MTRRHRTRSLAAFIVVLSAVLLSGCSLGLEFDRSKIDEGKTDAGGSIDAGSFDAGRDASTVKDAGTDAAPPDAGFDAGPDAGPLPMDAGSDAAADAAADAGDDAGADCTNPSQCPGTDTDCRVRACASGVCGFTNRAQGAAVSSGQTAGNCRRLECNGTGGTMSVDDDADVPADDGKQCTSETCNGGLPAHPSIAAHTDCPSTGGSDVCDGAGECVQCVTPSDCGTDTECITYECNSTLCDSTPAAPSTVLASGQTAGNCRQWRCDGSGGTVNAIDNADVPDDDKECTSDLCSAGTPSNPPLGSGVDCPVTGGSFVCDGSGSCLGCILDSDCGTDTECTDYQCNSNVCETVFTADGTALAVGQTTGNCKELRCNSSGGMVDAVDDGDVPDDGKECTTDACNAGTPSNPPLGSGVDCPLTGGANICDGGGQCVQCVGDADCGTDTECADYQCNSNACDTVFTADGTALVAGQTTGNCKELRCDATGGTVDADDDTDLPDDGNQCTADSCNAGSPQYDDEDTSTACTDDGGTWCDGSGSCVECNLDADCSPAICIDNACIAQGSLGSVSAAPESLVAGATGDFTVSFTTVHPLANDGVISIVFPAGYDISAVSVTGISGIDGARTRVISGQELVITRTSGTTSSAGAKSVSLSGLRNPQVSGAAGDVSVATKTSAGVDIDTGTSSNTVTLTAGEINPASVGLADPTQSATTTVTVAGTTSNPLPNDGVIEIVFPAGFDVSGATLSGVTGANGTFTLSVDAPNRTLTVTRNGDGAVFGAGAFSVALDGIVNPSTTGATGTYELRTGTAGAVLIDENAAVSGDDITS